MIPSNPSNHETIQNLIDFLAHRQQRKRLCPSQTTSGLPLIIQTQQTPMDAPQLFVPLRSIVAVNQPIAPDPRVTQLALNQFLGRRSGVGAADSGNNIVTPNLTEAAQIGQPQGLPSQNFSLLTTHSTPSFPSANSSSNTYSLLPTQLLPLQSTNRSLALLPSSDDETLSFNFMRLYLAARPDLEHLPLRDIIDSLLVANPGLEDKEFFVLAKNQIKINKNITADMFAKIVDRRVESNSNSLQSNSNLLSIAPPQTNYNLASASLIQQIIRNHSAPVEALNLPNTLPINNPSVTFSQTSQASAPLSSSNLNGSADLGLHNPLSAPVSYTSSTSNPAKSQGALSEEVMSQLTTPQEFLSGKTIAEVLNQLCSVSPNFKKSLTDELQLQSSAQTNTSSSSSSSSSSSEYASQSSTLSSSSSTQTKGANSSPSDPLSQPDTLSFLSTQELSSVSSSSSSSSSSDSLLQSDTLSFLSTQLPSSLSSCSSSSNAATSLQNTRDIDAELAEFWREINGSTPSSQIGTLQPSLLTTSFDELTDIPPNPPTPLLNSTHIEESFSAHRSLLNPRNALLPASRHFQGVSEPISAIWPSDPSILPVYREHLYNEFFEKFLKDKTENSLDLSKFNWDVLLPQGTKISPYSHPQLAYTITQKDLTQDGLKLYATDNQSMKKIESLMKYCVPYLQQGDYYLLFQGGPGASFELVKLREIEGNSRPDLIKYKFDRCDVDSPQQLRGIEEVRGYDSHYRFRLPKCIPVQLSSLQTVKDALSLSSIPLNNPTIKSKRGRKRKIPDAE